jgi:hypothetical protein
VTALELMVGAGFALLGAVAAEAVRRAEHPQVHGGRRMTVAAAAFPLTLLRETGQLAAAVSRALRRRGTPGTYVTIQLPPESDPALAAALLSASPNACVIDIEDRDLTAHVLVGTTSPVERALGGRRSG